MLLRIAALGKDEVLDAEEVTLNQKEFLVSPAFPHCRGGFHTGVVVPAPERGRQRGRSLAVVVERDLGLDTECGRGGHRVGNRQPKAVEVVEPQWQVCRVGAGNLDDLG